MHAAKKHKKRDETEEERKERKRLKREKKKNQEEGKEEEEEEEDKEEDKAGETSPAIPRLNGFKDIEIDSRLRVMVATFTKPTPIQSRCYHVIAQGRDCIGIAETGSGKTIAFALPLLQNVLKEAEKKSAQPRILVIAPTRELALQTHNVVSKCSGFGSICLYGGMPRREQLAELQTTRPVFVVGTPGRLLDFINDGSLATSQVHALVLDEADRMLDMGFSKDIAAIIAACPQGSARQTVMFSATWPHDVQKLAAKYLRENAVKIFVDRDEGDGKNGDDGGDKDGNAEDAHDGGDLKACSRVKQIVEVIKDPFGRDSRLLHLMTQYYSPQRRNRIIIFILYKKEAPRIAQLLSRGGYGSMVAPLHGDMSQAQRTQNLDSFRAGVQPILVATDVAARGLDIPDVEYVINYSFPLTIEDYVHRVGRTGRAGRPGTAHTFFTDLDKAHSGELVNVLNASKMEVPAALAAYGTHVKRKVHADYGAHWRPLVAGAKPKITTFHDDDDE